MGKNTIKILSLIERLDKNMTLIESENFTKKLRGDKIDVIEYHNGTDEWNKMILPNIQKIWNFLQEGYQGEFKGCDKITKIEKRANIIKIAYNNDNWVALSIYNPYMGGNKCVGICRTRVKELEDLGRKGVEMIIRQDINNYDKFYWCECSGKIEEYYKKNRGINIPSLYASSFLERNEIKIVDDFHYSRPLGPQKNMITKTIFGFNTPDTFNKIYAENKTYIEECIARIENNRLNEAAEKLGFGGLNKWQCWMEIVNVYIDLWIRGYHEFPAECLHKLLTVLDEMVNAVKKMPPEIRHQMNESIKQGFYIINNATDLELNIFD